MSIKDYPTEELLAEIAARIRTDSPLYDPQDLRDMLIKSESECSELRAQVERKDTRIKVLEVANDSLTQYSIKLTTERYKLRQALIEICNIVGGATDGVSTEFLMQVPKEVLAVKAERDTLRHKLQVERDTSNQRLTEIYDRARKAERERDALKARIEEMDAHGDRDMLLAQWNKAAAQRDSLEVRVIELEKDLAAWRDAAIAESRGRDVSDVDWVLRAHAAEDKLQALQARIDAGVRVYRTSNEEWMERKYAGSGASGLLIDIEYMHPDDDRNGEADRNAYRTPDLDAALTLDIESIERKKRADGSTTPRTGERRKGLEERCGDICRERQCFDSIGPCYTKSKEDRFHNNRRNPANERRAE